MHRREFIAGASPLLPGRKNCRPRKHRHHQREFYQLRRYALQSGPQVAMTEKYISDALIPALAKESGPVGAFRLDIGPETPTFYVLIPILAPAMAGALEFELDPGSRICEGGRAVLERSGSVAGISSDGLFASGGI